MGLQKEIRNFRWCIYKVQSTLGSQRL